MAYYLGTRELLGLEVSHLVSSPGMWLAIVQDLPSRLVPDEPLCSMCHVRVLVLKGRRCAATSTWYALAQQTASTGLARIGRSLQRLYKYK